MSDDEKVEVLANTEIDKFLHQIFGALHRNFSATINSDVTLKLTSLHIHLISGSFIFESRRHFKLFSKAGLC
jgi:hypothetical protein